MSRLEELREKYHEFRAESYLHPTGGLYGEPAELWKIVSVEDVGVDDEGNLIYWEVLNNCISEEEAYELLDKSFQPRKKLIIDGMEIY